MKMNRIVCSTTVLCLLAIPAFAQDGGESVPEQEEPLVVSDYQPPASEDQIVIRPGDNEVFYEYRVNGELTEIKVVPEVGKPYYLVPADGGGWIREDRSGTLIPSWVLFKW